MSLYLDTSCLLKLLFPEPESDAVARLLEAEPRVIVSTLACLEALGQLQGRVAGGALTRRSAKVLQEKLAALLASCPYELTTPPPSVIELALGQITFTRRAAHCRTLDRLHLATMQAVGLRRILTNDDPQAKAARALGFEAILPR